MALAAQFSTITKKYLQKRLCEGRRVIVSQRVKYIERFYHLSSCSINIQATASRGIDIDAKFHKCFSLYHLSCLSPDWINRIYKRSPNQTEKSKFEAKRIMPETRQTSFLALSVYPRVGISRSASETDV